MQRLHREFAEADRVVARDGLVVAELHVADRHLELRGRDLRHALADIPRRDLYAGKLVDVALKFQDEIQIQIGRYRSCTRVSDQPIMHNNKEHKMGRRRTAVE